MKLTYYMAYGSNLNVNSFLSRCNEAKFLGVSYLLNYRLVFKGEWDDCSYLTLEESEGSVVPIAIFLLTSRDILKLDKYEGYPNLYSKKYIMLNFNGKKINAMTYVINAKYDYYLPSMEYLNSCIHGYNYFAFDRSNLVRALEVTNQKKNRKR